MTLRRVQSRPAVWLDLVVKAGLTATLAAALVVPGLREFSERGLAGRVAASVIALVVVPAWWMTWGRHRRNRRYPFALDAVLALPFLIELWARPCGVGQLAGGTQIGHSVDFALLATALALVLARLQLPPVRTAVLVVAGGAAAAVLWELVEGWTFASQPALRSEDSIVDVLLALVASAVAAAATGLVLARKERGAVGHVESRG